MKNNSAKTSLNQVPALHKKIDWKFGQMNLDVGGGRFGLATEYVNSKGANNFIYDPYNQTKEHNTLMLSYINYDSATIANVLNVIETEVERLNALRTAQSHVIPGGKIYISVYEGNKSGIFYFSKTGTYQENRKLRTYLKEVLQVWPEEFVKIKKNMIEVTNGNYDTTPRFMCPSALLMPNS